MANFGDILSNLALSGSRSVRRNSGDTAFEAWDTSALAASVSNSDGTLTISPTTGAVVASLNLSNSNSWLAPQTFANGIVTLRQSSVIPGYSALILQGSEGSSGYGTILSAPIATDSNIYFNNLSGAGEFQFIGSDGTATYAAISSSGVSSFTGFLDLMNTSDGAVVFTNANGRYSTDDSNFHWDDTNNRLGIGTNAPSAKLHVLSTTEQARLGYNTSNYFSTTVSSAGLVTFDAAGTTPAFSFSDQIRSGSSGTAPSNAKIWLRNASDGAELMQFDRGNFSDDGFGYRLYVDSSGFFPQLRITCGLNDNIFNVGAKYYGAGGVGGSGIYFANFASGRGTQFAFASNMTDFVQQWAGNITFVNDTGNNSKKAGAYVSATTEDLYREAMGVQLYTNQTPTSSYPSGGFYLSSEQSTYAQRFFTGGDNGQTQYNFQGVATTEKLIVGGAAVVQDTTLANLGPELVTNGTFTGSATGWTLGTGWAYNSNNVAKNADGTGTLTQAITTVVGQRYSLRITFGAPASGSPAGTATVSITGGSTITLSPKLRATTIIYEYTFTANATTSTITITPTNTSRFTLDTIQCKLISRGDLTVVRNFRVLGAVDLAYIAKTADYTATINDYVIDCTANTFTLTLPTAVGIAGRIYNLKNSGTGIITINTTSSQTIDSQVSGYWQIIQYTNMCVQSNGANWIII